MLFFFKQESNELLNYILLLGKYFIYKTKFLANSIYYLPEKKISEREKRLNNS